MYLTQCLIESSKLPDLQHAALQAGWGAYVLQEVQLGDRHVAEILLISSEPPPSECELPLIASWRIEATRYCKACASEGCFAPLATQAKGDYCTRHAHKGIDWKKYRKRRSPSSRIK